MLKTSRRVKELQLVHRNVFPNKMEVDKKGGSVLYDFVERNKNYWQPEVNEQGGNNIVVKWLFFSLEWRCELFAYCHRLFLKGDPLWWSHNGAFMWQNCVLQPLTIDNNSRKSTSKLLRLIISDRLTRNHVQLTIEKN